MVRTHFSEFKRGCRRLRLSSLARSCPSGRLLAGDAAGGDKRGKQAAALKIYTTEDYPDWDIRVDDHPDAPAELARVFRVGQGAYAAYKDFIPTRGNPAGVTDREQMAAVRAKAEQQ